MTTRRSFLKSATYASLGTIALPTILPSCVKWKGANDRLYVGHIGVGSRGTDEMKSYFLPHRDFRTVAVSDVFKSRRDWAAQIVQEAYTRQEIQNPVVDSYNDYRELLDRKDIDIVAIATPDHWHLPIAIHAVQSGKHVHVNKPLGLSVGYMEKLREELSNTNLHFNYGTQQRSYDFMKKAMEYIHGGALGEISEVIVWAPGGGAERHIGYYKEMDIPVDLDYDRWLGPAPEAPYTADRVHRDGSFFISDYSIGFLGGWGAHPLDILVWGLKDRISGNYSVEATGKAQWPVESMYDNVNVWDSRLTYENGLKVHFISQDLAKNEVMKYQKDFRQNGTLFIGSKGWMTLSRTYAECSIPEINESINNFPKKDFGLNGDRGMHAIEFANLIRGESQQYMSIQDAILSDMISHNTNAAIRLNQTINWDALTSKIIGSAEGNSLINRDHRARL